MPEKMLKTGDESPPSSARCVRSLLYCRMCLIEIDECILMINLLFNHNPFFLIYYFQQLISDGF